MVGIVIVIVGLDNALCLRKILAKAKVRRCVVAFTFSQIFSRVKNF